MAMVGTRRARHQHATTRLFGCGRAWHALTAAAILVFAVVTPLPVLAARPVVAVFAIEDKRSKAKRLSDRQLGNLADYLATLMAQSGAFRVIPSIQLREALRSQKAKSYDKACYDDSCQIEIGKAVAAQMTLATKIMRLGGRCIVSTQLYDLAREASGKATSNKGSCTEDALTLSLERCVAQLASGRPKSGRPAAATADEDVDAYPGAWEPETGRQEAVVRFASDPPGAVVQVDGDLLCTDTAESCSGELTVGAHTVTMQKKRYRKRTETVSVGRGTEVTWKLEPNFGWLDVKSNPSGLDVKIDGKVVGQTPLSGYEIDPGTHRVVVGNRCFYERGKKRLGIARGERRTLDLEMRPRWGAIEIRAKDRRSKPVEADVLVDGKQVGRTPGTFKVSVCAERVQVQSRYGGWSMAVSVPERKTVRLRAVLDGTPGPPFSDGSMVLVPAGEFWMGCSRRDSSCDGDEKPGRKVYLDAFEIDRTEGTVAQYRACVEAGRCPHPQTDEYRNWGKSGRDDHPINGVSWSDANTYCRWAGKQLPTEAQWEKAARGTDGRVYPWGDEKASCRYAVMDDGGSGCRTFGTMPVGSKPAGASPYGALDMAGNVLEWTADWYAKHYYGKASSRNPPGAAGGRGSAPAR